MVNKKVRTGLMIVLFAIVIMIMGCWDDGDAEGYDSGGHTYNIVVYKGSYRIMDYGEIGSEFDSSSYSESYGSDNIWNDKVGEWWYGGLTDPATYSYNYPMLTTRCPSGGWTDHSYYRDVCQDIQ